MDNLMRLKTTKGSCIVNYQDVPKGFCQEFCGDCTMLSKDIMQCGVADSKHSKCKFNQKEIWEWQVAEMDKSVMLDFFDSEIEKGNFQSIDTEQLDRIQELTKDVKGDD